MMGAPVITQLLLTHYTVFQRGKTTRKQELNSFFFLEVSHKRSKEYILVFWVMTSSSPSSCRDSSVCIATGYGLDGGRGLIPGRDKVFLFSSISRPALGLTRGGGVLCLEVKRPGRETSHSPPASAEVEKDGAIHPLPRMSLSHCD
jgi:hypothetical protein